MNSTFIIYIYQHSLYLQYLLLDNLLTPSETRLSLCLQTLLPHHVEGGVFVRVPVPGGDGDVAEILLWRRRVTRGRWWDRAWGGRGGHLRSMQLLLLLLLAVMLLLLLITVLHAAVFVVALIPVASRYSKLCLCHDWSDRTTGAWHFISQQKVLM